MFAQSIGDRLTLWHSAEHVRRLECGAVQRMCECECDRVRMSQLCGIGKIFLIKDAIILFIYFSCLYNTVEFWVPWYVGSGNCHREVLFGNPVCSRWSSFIRSYRWLQPALFNHCERHPIPILYYQCQSVSTRQHNYTIRYRSPIW